jgi:hypothetical protein
MSQISASVSGASPITASVGETQIDVAAGSTAATVDVAVSGGFGPTGSSGVVTVSAPVTNSGTSSAANIGLAVGAGLSTVGGALVVSYGTTAGTACQGNDARLSDARTPLSHTHTASQITDFTTAVIAAAPPTTNASLLTSGTLSADRLPLAAANTRGAVRIGSGISIDGDGVISASSGYTLPTATGSVLGGVKIGTGVSITDGVISVSTAYAATSHAHDWGDITSGVPAALSGGYFAIDEDDFLCLRSLDLSNPIRVETIAGSFGGFKLYSLDFYDPATDSFATQTTAWTGGVDAANVTGLATVATSGSYDDLDDLPTLFDGAYSSLTGLPTLHDRSHAITSSSDHTATAWRVFHSDASGQIVELALGAAGTVLTSGGASAAPTWAAGGGAVRSDTVSNVSYIGRALSGSATSASVWTIRRTTVASAGTVTTATAANVKWDDRLTASYS